MVVASVGNDHEFVIVQPVDNQVVDDAAVFGADHRVLCSAVLYFRELGNKCVVKKIFGLASNSDLCHMADIKQTTAISNAVVFVYVRPIANRHVPATKLGETGPQFFMLRFELSI